MTAGVWVVGGPTDDNRDDLRHSLRSVEANAPQITETWVIGDIPDWYAGTRMPLPPRPLKFENQRASLTAFVNYPGAPDTFWLFNDDMFVTEPCDDLPIIRNKTTAATWGSDHRGPHGPDCWTCAVKATAAWTAAQAGGDVFLYENHTPLLFDTARLRDAVNDYPDQPFAVGELYPIAGLGGEGRVGGNAKVKAADSLTEKLNLPMPYLSGNPDSWDGQLGTLIRSMFDQPSRWER